MAAQDELQPAAELPTKSGRYIVELAEPPVVAYDGGVRGLRATRPAEGEKINPQSADVTRYVAHLQGRQDAALRAVGGGTKSASYVYAFNGFAAELTGAQAADLAETEGVVAVTPDELRQLDTATTPDFLGLTESGGLWEQLTTGATRGRTATGPGEGVIIGIIDSGIWPEHPSVSDRDASGKRVYQAIPGWNGRCVPGENFDASLCNQKLIGARFYNSGWGGNAGIDQLFPYEFNSPRDADGHGTHTATTAGGNQDVPATGPASVFGTVSGIAPRARIAAYKVCWGNGGEGGCFGADSVAAIDQAVADGVDVINFSISGTRTSFRDPVEIAFLFAADAGVFVAASAGNSGPTTSTVAHPSPWITTVAAGTHDRNGLGEVTLGNGASYQGASVATAVGPAPLVDSVDVGLPGASASEVELCYPGTLDPAAVAGKIVLCLRGVIARTDKSLAVQQAGGVGMVMYNNSDNSLNADFHFVPTVHVNSVAGLAIKAYAATPGATASIADASIVNDVPAPFTASFSSRGPLLAGNGDLLKPDLIAPGQDIVAGVSPVGYNGRLFDLLSGTSMSSPHVAGLAALLIQAHPDWSPMAVKSALMTTGYDVLDGGTPAPNGNPVLIFRQGAGHVDPNKAVNPGLVFDSGFNDWLSLICATQPEGLAATCAGLASAGYPTDASDFNSPSIAIGDLVGSQTVTRTVTNVSGDTATFRPSTTGMVGIETTVSPDLLTLAPGETGQFTVTFTRTTAALNAYTGGQLTWTNADGGNSVRIPMVVRPVALSAPASVTSTGDAISYDVKFGYSGAFSATGRGLVAARTTAGSVEQDPDQTFNPGDATGTVAIPVTVPAGTTYQRFALFDADVAPGADLDLYVYRGSTPMGSSASGTSAEEVNLISPTAGAYTVYVHGWGVPSGSSPFVLHDWSIPATDAGNMMISAPTSATTGQTGTVNLTFSGLNAATKYLGSVVYAGASGLPAPTIVSVNTP